LVIVGESSIPPQSGNVFNRAFRWTEAGGMQSLGVLSGATDSIALGVSRDAAVIVGFNYSLSTTDPRAFKWTAAQGMTELPVLPGGSGALATAASLDGSIVVGLSETTHGAGERAARWTPGGVENLGILPGAEFGRAEAVSGDGSAVVGYNHFASSGLDQAFFWNPTNGMQDLKAFLVASGINLSGWNLIDANGVSADGLTIVGYGITPAGQIEGWVATIPTPTAAYPLFLVLLAGSLRNRAHRATADGADQRRS
jgi:uncharacterized membrane protein